MPHIIIIIMHEISIAQNLLKIACNECLKHNRSVITLVYVRIGELSSIVPDALRFSFQIISEGTIAEGATLEIETVPVRGLCPKCGNEFKIDSPSFLCANCGDVSLKIISGKELELSRIEAM